jgi:hypothetical protein
MSEFKLASIFSASIVKSKIPALVCGCLITLLCNSNVFSASNQITMDQVVDLSKKSIKACSLYYEIGTTGLFVARKAAADEAESTFTFASIDKGNYAEPGRGIIQALRAKAASSVDTVEYMNSFNECVIERKDRVIGLTKVFLKDKKNQGGQMKDLIAQWITTMDSIGSEQFAESNIKFQTIANRLLID